jgi:hypothetical protein
MARHEITLKKVVYHIPAADAVTVRNDIPYHATADGDLTMDVYYPPDTKSAARIPAVVFVMGFSDIGARAILGCAASEMESYIGWARLIGASGLIAVTYRTGREPAADTHAALQYVRQQSASLMIDENRIGIWACSGHVPTALSLLMKDCSEPVKCAALCYGITLDLDGATGVAEAAKTFRFVNASAGRSVEDLSTGVPMFVTRSGRDETPGLNDALDRFLSHAVRHNLPLTFVNHPDAPHAFDLMHDSETSREIIRRIIGFLRFHLLGTA